MARDKKFGQRKSVKCSLCGKTFKATRYLKQHMEVHNNNNNNNNNKNKYNNKNLLKKFIKFIIKIIIIINEEFDILNYVGDKRDQKRAIHNLQNKVPDTKLAKTIILIDEGPDAVDVDNLVDDMAKDKDAFKLCGSQWGSDIDKKVAEYKRILNVKKAREEQKKKKEEKENKKYENIMKYISKFGGPQKKSDEYGNIKIKRNIIKSIAEQRKEKIVKAIENKIRDIAEEENKNKNEEEKIDINNIKLGPKEEPMVAYEADFLCPKISARQLFNQTVPDERIKKFIINYINKKYVDYPTDKEIEEYPLAYSHYTKTLSGNGLYKEKFDNLQNKILEYFENGGESFRCEYCNKYVFCKRRHCLHCKNFLKAIENDPKQLILKKYLEKNYKKIKIQEIDLILKHFEGKDPEFIKKNLPNYLKFRRQIRLRLIKKQNKKREIAEKSGIEISELPPIHFNTGLAKKLLKQITDFDNKKK